MKAVKMHYSLKVLVDVYSMNSYNHVAFVKTLTQGISRKTDKCIGRAEDLHYIDSKCLLVCTKR